MFIRTTAINKILQLKKFTRGIQGGSSAGKTYAILPILIDIATKSALSEISVVAESIPHLK
jgi:phage terminase large subunit